MPTKRTAPAPTDAAQSLTATKPLDCAQSTRDPLDVARSEVSPFDAAEVLADAWVLVVRVNAGHYRRRVFLSIAPAWQAARRAADRGYSADVVLCRLEPIRSASR